MFKRLLSIFRKAPPAPEASATPILDRMPRELRDAAVSKLVELAGTESFHREGESYSNGGADGYRSARATRVSGTEGVNVKPSRGVLTGAAMGSMRAKCRASKRNNAVVRGFLRRKCEHIVGTGFTFQCRSGDADWDKEQSRRLNEWAAQEAKLWRVAQWAVRAWDTDGGAPILKIRKADGRCLFQTIDPARIVTPSFDSSGRMTPLTYDNGTVVKLPGGNTINKGVETDEDGVVVAYYVAAWSDEEQLQTKADRTGKPASGGGQVVATGGPGGGLGSVVRVPAALMIFLTPETFGEPDETWAEPGLQATLPLMELLYKYMEDYLIAADMATLFGILITVANPAQEKKNDMEMMGDVNRMASAVAAGEQPDLVLESGLAKYLAPGSTVEQVKPEFPQEHAVAFMKGVAQFAANEHGLPPMFAFFDMAGTTASNGKMIVSMTYRGFETPQEVLEVDLFLAGGRFKLGSDIARGTIKLPKVADPLAWRNIKVFPPSPPVLDNKTETEGWALRIEKNLTTHENACMQLGEGNGDEVAAIRARENERDRKLGITPVLAPGAKGPSEASKNDDESEELEDEE